MKKFNLYWEGAYLSSGSPHAGDYVIDDLFNDGLTPEDAEHIDRLEVGEKHIDGDGDTWERTA